MVTAQETDQQELDTVLGCAVVWFVGFVAYAAKVALGDILALKGFSLQSAVACCTR